MLINIKVKMKSKFCAIYLFGNVKIILLINFFFLAVMLISYLYIIHGEILKPEDIKPINFLIFK